MKVGTAIQVKLKDKAYSTIPHLRDYFYFCIVAALHGAKRPVEVQDYPSLQLDALQ